MPKVLTKKEQEMAKAIGFVPRRPPGSQPRLVKDIFAYNGPAFKARIKAQAKEIKSSSEEDTLFLLAKQAISRPSPFLVHVPTPANHKDIRFEFGPACPGIVLSKEEKIYMRSIQGAIGLLWAKTRVTFDQLCEETRRNAGELKAKRKPFESARNFFMSCRPTHANLK